MSGTEADGPVQGPKGEAGQLIIALGSAAVADAVVGCLRARVGRNRDWCIKRPPSPLFYKWAEQPRLP